MNVDVYGYSDFPIPYRKSSVMTFHGILLKVHQNRYMIPLGFFVSSVIVGMLFIYAILPSVEIFKPIYHMYGRQR